VNDVIKKVTGTQDILSARYTDKPDAQVERWHVVERVVREAFRLYGFSEIRTPIIERTELFERGVGAETDVNKEMYTFEDKGDKSISLRPESTASAVRAFTEHSLGNHTGLAKLFYIGPQFRREHPQKGRYRQFWQIGAEVIGQSDDPSIEAEIIQLLGWFLAQLGINDSELLVNSIGDENCRPAYLAALKEAIGARLPNLCASCRQRYETNPLRVLDCKEEPCQPYLEQLPAITESLCEPCSVHFEEFKRLLSQRGIEYRISPRLVRGLDYYKRTAFEIVGQRLGAQNTIVGGGRYDGLSEMIGGPPLKGFGFALGMERLILSMPADRVDLDAERPSLFIAYIGSEARDHSFQIAGTLRGGGISTVVDLEGRKLKKALAVANDLKAKFSLIVGEDEIKKGAYTLRDMATGEQKELTVEGLLEYLTAKG
jgi:histidyl-tRNA synthetase